MKKKRSEPAENLQYINQNIIVIAVTEFGYLKKKTRSYELPGLY